MALHIPVAISAHAASSIRPQHVTTGTEQVKRLQFGAHQDRQLGIPELHHHQPGSAGGAVSTWAAVVEGSRRNPAHQLKL